MKKMLRANLTGPERMKLEEVKIPEIKEDEVLIQVKVCGICGSDIHSYKGKHPFVHPPIVLGHEFSGVISKLGSKVKSLKEKDKVTVEPNIVCGKCYNCREGRYNICTNLKVIGCVGYNGALVEYIAVPEEKVIKLPEKFSFEEAALVEPAAVAIHAVRKSGQRLGNRVLILGAGTIGLLVMQAAKLQGAGEVVISELLEYRLKRAEDLGADRVVNSSSGDLIKLMERSYGKEGIDLIYDCVGIEETIFQSIQIARKGTKIIIVGVPEGNIKVDLAWVQDRELELVGSLMYTRGDFTTALNLIQREKLQVKPLITHKFKLKDVEKAFKILLKGEEEVLKVLIYL
jgi:L-iditol 2-dehydrogenase